MSLRIYVHTHIHTHTHTHTCQPCPNWSTGETLLPCGVATDVSRCDGGRGSADKDMLKGVDERSTQESIVRGQPASCDAFATPSFRASGFGFKLWLLWHSVLGTVPLCSSGSLFMSVVWL